MAQNFAGCERGPAWERQAEEMVIAKQAERYACVKASSPERVCEVLARAAAGEANSVLATQYGVSRSTIYRALEGHP